MPRRCELLGHVGVHQDQAIPFQPVDELGLETALPVREPVVLGVLVDVVFTLAQRDIPMSAEHDGCGRPGPSEESAGQWRSCPTGAGVADDRRGSAFQAA